MPTPTYIALATVTLASTATSVTFSAITGSYRDLVLIGSAKITSANGLQIRANSDATSSNYSTVAMYGDGSSASSLSGNNNGIGHLDNGWGNILINVMDYSATDKHKTMLARSNCAGSFTFSRVTKWSNTSAITSLELYGDTFQIGSQFSLYGIVA